MKATLTSKGQLTLPVAIRRELGLTAGSQVEFVSTAPGVWELRVKTGSALDLFGRYRGRGPALTVEQMDEAIGDEVAARDAATRSAP